MDVPPMTSPNMEGKTSSFDALKYPQESAILGHSMYAIYAYIGVVWGVNGAAYISSSMGRVWDMLRTCAKGAVFLPAVGCSFLRLIKALTGPELEAVLVKAHEQVTGTDEQVFLKKKWGPPTLGLLAHLLRFGG